MPILRSLLFNFFIYSGIILVFLIALPSLFLPSKITLLFGKFLGHYVIFVVRIFLNTKVEIKGIRNIPKSEIYLNKEISTLSPNTDLQCDAIYPMFKGKALVDKVTVS